MSGRRALLTGVAALTVLAAPATAKADEITVRDGNDVSTKLDIRSVSQGHTGRRLTHSLRTYGSFSSRFLDGNNLIAFGFDTNGSARSAERFAVVFWAGGRLRAVVVNAKGHLVAKAGVSRPNSRSVRVMLSRSSLGSPVAYRWAGFTNVGRKGDAAPNHRLILHDITGPKISFPNPQIPADTTYDLTFSVSDTGGAGVGEWRVERRTLGTSAWSTAATGEGGGSQTVSIAAAEGDDDQVRIIAFDRAGNQGTTSVIRTVSVPVDDGNAVIVYSGSAWNHATGIPDVFLGSLSSTAQPGDSFTYSFTGRYLAVVGTATCSNGTYSLKDSGGNIIADFWHDPCNGQPRQILFSTSLDTDSYELTFGYSVGDPLSFDGIVAR
jgi:hypothetical protein